MKSPVNGPIETSIIPTPWYIYALGRLTTRLQNFLRDLVKDIPNIVSVEVLLESTTRIEARIYVLYTSDIEVVTTQINLHLRSIETLDITPNPLTGPSYFGRRFISFIPSDVLNDEIPQKCVPSLFELQIRPFYRLVKATQ
mgnify:CR=1 FL=1